MITFFNSKWEELEDCGSKYKNVISLKDEFIDTFKDEDEYFNQIYSELFDEMDEEIVLIWNVELQIVDEVNI